MRNDSLLKISALSAALLTLPSWARADDAPVAAESLEKVVVTGSRIARAAKEGPTAVTVITSKDLETLGYKNVYDALNQQTQNTGFTQGADFGNTFTPAANAVSLRGLGPNHTLVLINGRRVADYPIAYEGSINFVNLANIPSALVERIEILNSGASAVYGSDAIAGVINIILKKHADGIDVNAKIGATQHGGGKDWRLQVSGGKDFGALSTVFAAEISQRDPLWSRDRDFMASTTAQGEAPTVVWGRKDVATGRYLSPGNACQNLAGNFSGSVTPYASKKGTYCGSGSATPSFWTIQTKNASQNFYGGATYALTDKTDLFADFMLALNTTENNTRGPSWTSASGRGGYFFNQNTGRNEVWTRRFAPEEIGGASRYNRKWEDSANNLTFGIRGQFGDSSWNYEAAYNASSYLSYSFSRAFLNGLDSAFLGPQLGTTASGVPIYAPDANQFGQPVSQQQFDALTGVSKNRNKAWTQNLSFSANGELVDLPSGPLKLATTVELGSQGFSNTPDAQINQGVFYNSSSSQRVAGSRSRYALGGELAIPVLKQLNATLAARYDSFEFADRSISKLTYNAGLEFRPVKTLLLRGNYATSFRAPDMNYIFASETKGYYASSTDYYRCQKAGQPLADCEYANMSPGANYVQTGSKDLKPENGKSFGYGVVWSPSQTFDISVDYWNIRLSDEVTNLSADGVLRDEAACRSGQNDINSALCVDALSRVKRNAANAPLNPDAIQSIRVNPINAASERTSGVDLAAKLAWKVPVLGDFTWHVNYTKVLSHRYKQFANDPETNSLKDPGNTDWPSKLGTSLDWKLGNLTSTLSANRYGRIPSADQKSYLSPTWLANLSVGYRFGKKASAQIIINNLFDKVKRDDSGGWPYYPVGNYTPYGRQAWLEFNYHFDK